MGNFCINCGTKLGKDDNFCMNCGTKVEKEIGSGKTKSEEVKFRANQIVQEYEIKKEQRQTSPAKENKIRNEKINETKMASGGYCSYNCRHCYEEFFDDGGGIVGDFDSGGYTEYYCRMGHSLSFGRFCKDFE